jgi:hypothetical protein
MCCCRLSASNPNARLAAAQLHRAHGRRIPRRPKPDDWAIGGTSRRRRSVTLPKPRRKDLPHDHPPLSGLGPDGRRPRRGGRMRRERWRPTGSSTCRRYCRRGVDRYAAAQPSTLLTIGVRHRGPCDCADGNLSAGHLPHGGTTSPAQCPGLTPTAVAAIHVLERRRTGLHLHRHKRWRRRRHLPRAANGRRDRHHYHRTVRRRPTRTGATDMAAHGRRIRMIRREHRRRNAPGARLPCRHTRMAVAQYGMR